MKKVKMPFFKIHNPVLRYLAGTATVIIGAGVFVGILYGLGILGAKIFDVYPVDFWAYIILGFGLLLLIGVGGYVIWEIRKGTINVAEEWFYKIKNRKLAHLLGFVSLAPYCIYAIFYLGLYNGVKTLSNKFYDP